MIETYYQVSSVEEALGLLNLHGEKAKIIAGATDLWLEQKSGIHNGVNYFIDISRIDGLDSITLDDSNNVHLGPLVTHSHCVRSSILKESARCLYEACLSVGSPQIRNRGTVAGNVFTASPANDTISALMALDATIVVASVKGNREIPITELYTGVRKHTIAKNEIIIDIWFSKLEKERSFSFFVKQGLRKAQAISLLNLSVACKLSDSREIEDLRIAFGSVAPTVIRARAAEKYATGMKLDNLEIDKLAKIAMDSISPITDLRSTAEYRKSIAGVLLKRKLLDVINGDQVQISDPKGSNTLG